jgi:hypothetical protein
MVKKLKTQKNKSSAETGEKIIDFSSLIDQTNKKLSKQTFADISVNTVNFDINPTSSDLEKKYQKKYITYLHEEFNFKIVKMFFNYISFSKIIPQSVKDNRPFIVDFLKIITNLLMNELDISTMAYLIENQVKWLGQDETDLIWNHLYNVCLKTKQITSDNDISALLLNILDMKNKGFLKYYNNWIKVKKVPNDVDIKIINEMYNELMKSNYLNQNMSKFINYNEAVDKILKFSEKQKKEVKPKVRRIEKKIHTNAGTFNPNINTINQDSSIFQKGPFMSMYDDRNLSIQHDGSNSDFQNYDYNGSLEMPKNNQNLLLSKTNSNYFTKILQLNLMKADSGRSFASSINEQNINNQM